MTLSQSQINTNTSISQNQAITRKDRGLQIAKIVLILKTARGWKVPNHDGSGSYYVTSDGHKTICTCPDYQTRRQKCKHIWAVELLETGQVRVQINTVDLTNKEISSERKTYSQDWKSYDTATINQKSLFMKFLRDITNQIKTPDLRGQRGRPQIPPSEMIYTSVMKVFSTFSLRRCMGDMEQALENGYIEQKPCYSSVGHFMQNADLTPILVEMVKTTSLPLAGIESDFAIDSTGFGTNCFQRWYSFKHGREMRTKTWVKCHFVTGVKTNIITSVKITSEFDNDSPQLPELIKQTAESFDMKEVSCDKAYLSRNNLEVISEAGATPYIPFKSNNKARGKGSIWMKMYHTFMSRQDEFCEHYHKRSNAETTVHMIKSKFGDSVRSKSWTAQVNEVLCKVICHNICVVIQEMFELGIKPEFK